MRGSLVTFEVRDAHPDVLVVTNAWPRNDDPVYGIFVKRQIDSLRSSGIRMDVMFIRGYLSKGAYAVAAASLARLSRSSRPRYRLVHAHGGETVVSAVAYRRAPILASFMGDDLLGTPNGDAHVLLPSRIRRTILRQSARLVSRTITKSHEMHLALPQACRGRNDVVPNGVDGALFSPADRGEARRLLGWAADARIALFGGDPAVPRKRFPLAQAATRLAAGALPDVQLKSLGGVTPADVPLMMNAADCLLLPSSIEGSPNVVKEALMCNLPVVATPAGDVRELLRDVSPSWICPPEAPALADALVECLRVPNRSDGRARSPHLTAEAIAERVRLVYELALGGSAQNGG